MDRWAIGLSFIGPRGGTNSDESIEIIKIKICAVAQKLFWHSLSF